MPGAIGADDADLVAADDRRRQRRRITVGVAVAEAETSFGLDDQACPSARPPAPGPGPTPAFSRRWWRASRIALRARTRPSFRVRRASTPFLIQDLFLRQPLVEERRLAGLGGEQLLATLEEGRVVAGPVEELARGRAR